MCSSFTLTADPEELRAYFRYRNPAEFPPRERIAPTEPIIIVREENKAMRCSVLVRWGFIPHWVKDPDDFPLIINARAETLGEKPSFRTSLAHKRCLIPATGFFEWSGEKGARQKHHIELKSKTPFAFAGLWDHWMGADGSEFESAAIITVAANNDIATIHHRMPAIIESKDFDEWLNVKDVRAGDAAKLLKPAPEGLFNIKSATKPVKSQTAKPKTTNEKDQGDLFNN